MNELDLFTEALNRTDPAERAAFLDRACAGNPELRRRLEELLAGHARSRSPLDRPPLAPENPRRPSTSRRRSRPGCTDPTRGRRPWLTSIPWPPRTWNRWPPRPRPTRPGSSEPTGQRRSTTPTPDATAAASEAPTPRAAPSHDGRRDRHRHRRPVHAGRGDRRGRHGLGLPGQPDRAGQASGGVEADQDGDGFAGRAGPVRRRAAGAGPDGPPQHRPHLRRRPHPGRPAVLRHGAGAGACRSPTTATGSGCR